MKKVTKGYGSLFEKSSAKTLYRHRVEFLLLAEVSAEPLFVRRHRMSAVRIVRKKVTFDQSLRQTIATQSDSMRSSTGSKPFAVIAPRTSSA